MKISLIIPAYNEEKTNEKVMNVARKVKLLDEIIVVDDGSVDSTKSIAKKYDIRWISHKTNFGKGTAISTGIKKANGDILVFIDADLANISPRKITALIHPILNNEADFTKATFKRKRGRVTELAVKPLLKTILPMLDFSQPLSGQFAAKREFLEKIRINPKWGVDIQLLLEAFKNKLRIKEVDIGKIVHKKQPVENLIAMSEQVIQTILEETGIIGKSHKLIAFDLDSTLIQGSSIEFIAKKWGFEKELGDLRERYRKGKIKEYEITISLAKYFKGKSLDETYAICRKIKLARNAKKIIEMLKKRQYKVVIISVAFSPVVEYFANLLEADENSCPKLIAKEGKFTGEVELDRKFNNECCDFAICKREKLIELSKKYNLGLEECVAVGDGKSDKCMFEASGLSISKGKKINADLCIKNLAEVLVMVD